MKGVYVEYTDSELTFIKKNCRMPRRELHTAFCVEFERDDITFDNIKSLCTRKGWSTGRTGSFEKGNVPHNAGTAGTGLMKANKTSFRKGNVPANIRPIGASRINKDGFIEVKVGEPKVWKGQHIINWEAENGPIPVGYCLTFVDGDPLNIDLDNLELLNRNELLQINRLSSRHGSDDVRPVVRTLGKMMAKRIDLKTAVT